MLDVNLKPLICSLGKEAIQSRCQQLLKHDISSDDLKSLIVQVPPHTKLRVGNNNLSAADLETPMPNKWINDQVTLVNNYACT